MITFYCTKAAAAFFSVTRKGEVVSPIEATTDLIECEDRSAEESLNHWQVHAVRIARKYVLVVMAQDSRYSMVFADLKKGDWQGFLELFHQRLLNNMHGYGEEFQIMDESEFEPMAAEAIKRLGKFKFVQHSDRSVQAHLNDVVRHFADAVDEMGVLPNNQEEAAGFDEWVNTLIRLSRRTGDYQLPFKTMLLQWIQHICGATPAELKQADDLIMQALRTRFLPETKGVAD